MVEGLRTVEQGHARGKIVLTMSRQIGRRGRLNPATWLRPTETSPPPKIHRAGNGWQPPPASGRQ